MVEVAPAKHVGEECATEGALARALRSAEERGYGIAVLGVEAQPLLHHREEPDVEGTLPEGIARSDATCELSDAVLPIPLPAHAAEELAQGVAHWDVSALQIGTHEANGLDQAGLQDLELNGGLGALVEELPTACGGAGPEVGGTVDGVAEELVGRTDHAHHGACANGVVGIVSIR